jgi:fumarate hydratase class II
MTTFRTEHDSMGELQVPADALYGAQTQRAINNFPISGLHLPREFIRALGLIKAAAAEVAIRPRPVAPI